MRPGYSHISETISELFSPGSPNKLLLDTLHTGYALLMALFGVGMLQFVRGSGHSTPMGIVGASLFIAVGLLSVAVASVFPQDPWGTPPTFRGQMHMTLSAVTGLLSILCMLLMGIWSDRAGVFQGFRTHSFVTIGVVALSAGLFVATVGSPIMGLTERIAALVGFQWTFTLAWRMFLREGYAARRAAGV